MADEPKPPPHRPPMGNPKGSFYDQGLHRPEPPEPPVVPPTATEREGTNADTKAGYRGPLVSPPPLDPSPHEPVILGNPKGSYYDRGVSPPARPRSRTWLSLVAGAVIVLAVGIVAIVYFVLHR